MANVLNKDKQIAVIAALAEGSSIRAIERMMGIHRDKIMRLGVRVGQGCAEAKYVQSVSVQGKFQGQIVWDGVVEVFDLTAIQKQTGFTPGRTKRTIPSTRSDM